MRASPRGLSGAVLAIAVRIYPDLKPTQPERKAPEIDGMLVSGLRSWKPRPPESVHLAVGGVSVSRAAHIG